MPTFTGVLPGGPGKYGEGKSAGETMRNQETETTCSFSGGQPK